MLVKNITAFDVYDAIFSESNEWAENSVEYIQHYCDGVWNMTVLENAAKKILECRKNWLAHNDHFCTDDFYRIVKEPLEGVSL